MAVSRSSSVHPTAKGSGKRHRSAAGSGVPQAVICGPEVAQAPTEQRLDQAHVVQHVRSVRKQLRVDQELTERRSATSA